MQRLRQVGTLEQLRGLLRELRDGGELRRLGGSQGGAAGEVVAGEQGQPGQPGQDEALMDAAAAAAPPAGEAAAGAAAAAAAGGAEADPSGVGKEEEAGQRGWFSVCLWVGVDAGGRPQAGVSSKRCISLLTCTRRGQAVAARRLAQAWREVHCGHAPSQPQGG